MSPSIKTKESGSSVCEGVAICVGAGVALAVSSPLSLFEEL